MEAIGDHLGAIFIAVVSTAGTVLVTLLKSRGDKSMSLPDQYASLMQEMKGWTTTQLEQRDRQLEWQGGTIKDLRRDVSELQDEVQTWRRKFFLAVEYIRIIRRSVENRDSLPPVPDHLRDDI